MEENSDTEEYESRKKMRKVTTAADLFRQIQSQPIKPGPSHKTPVRSQNVQREETIDSSSPESETETPTYARRDSSPPMNADVRQPSGWTPTLEPRGSVDDPPTQEPDLRQLLLSLHEKVDENTRKIEECKLAEQRKVALLSQLNAKVDVFVSQFKEKLDAIVSQKPQQNQLERYGTMNAPLKAVKNLEEFKCLDVKSKDELFAASVIQYFGSMHGKDRYVGEGGTVCLQIVDSFFDREFMMSCSWTGTTRNKNSDETAVTKIPFQKFDGVITLFHKVVMHSDPSYSLVECQKFLHRCLRNAKQRFEEIKGTRASVARKRKRNKRRSVDNEEEEREEGAIVYQPDELDTSDSKPIIVEEWRMK